MRKWLRPIILACFVSFLLGIWFSLQRAENHLLGRLKTLPKITLLTDQPNWWTELSRRAAKERIAELELLSPPRHEWEAIIRNGEGGCHIVALRSFFEDFFVTNEIVAPFPDDLKQHGDQVHADFRAKDSDGKSYFLPLAWSVSQWRRDADASKEDARFRIKTSPDEALMTAYDLSLVAPPEGTIDEDLDWPDLAKAAWEKFSAAAYFDLTGADTSVPRFPVKGTQEYGLFEATEPLPADFPAGGNSNLWTYGLALCRAPIESQTLSRLLYWLMAPEQIGSLLRASGLKGALLSLEQGEIPEDQRPSALRRFSLARLRQSNLDWSMAAAWYELITNDDSE